MEATPRSEEGVDGVTRERTLGVVAACVAFMLAAAATGLVLFHNVQGPPRSTWNDYRETARGLSVAVSAEGCSRVLGADVVERDRAVRVTLVVERELPWYGYCASRSTADRVRVDLDQPLAGRQVVDGACLERERRARPCIREKQAAKQRTGTAVLTSNR
jgi:hypothetical protein